MKKIFFLAAKAMRFIAPFFQPFRPKKSTFISIGVFGSRSMLILRHLIHRAR